MLNMFNENVEDEEMELLQIDFENASIDDLDDDDDNHERRVGANEVYDDANEKVGETKSKRKEISYKRKKVLCGENVNKNVQQSE